MGGSRTAHTEAVLWERGITPIPTFPNGVGRG